MWASDSSETSKKDQFHFISTTFFSLGGGKLSLKIICFQNLKYSISGFSGFGGFYKKN